MEVIKLMTKKQSKIYKDRIEQALCNLTCVDILMKEINSFQPFNIGEFQVAVQKVRNLIENQQIS